MARELDRCGTIGAHNRHVRAKERVDPACRQAWLDYKQETKPVTVRIPLPQFEDAACATPYGMRLFADVTEDTLPEARDICRTCPVQLRCLQWGVLYEDEGLWGGMTRGELRRERHRHGIRRQEPNSTWITPRVQPQKQGAAA